jgi:hypothetical protein
LVDGGGGFGLAKPVALAKVKAQPSQGVHIGLGFDALADGGEVELVGQGDKGKVCPAL